MSLKRCPHGVYVPVGSPRGLSPYCTGCTDSRGPVPFFETRSVQIPNTHTTIFNANDVLHANARSPYACPKCGSMVYLRKNEKGTDVQRICADCGANYRGKLRYTALVAAAKEEAGYAD
jgi:ribosomal protein L37AE/L43A